METHSLSRRLTAVAVLATAALFAGRSLAGADELTEEQIVRALTPVTTRALTLTSGDALAEQKNLLDSVRNRSAHSLTAEEREKIAIAAANKRSIDIEINFDFRSAKIGRTAVVSIDTLGRALTNPDLKGMTFVLAGHTDAKGGANYNQDLSEKRVDAVRRYLVDRFKLPTKDLVAVGYGKTRLKNESDPFGAENRRVQIVNMDDSSN
jgi:outer membrane protein OmpA-like peptidoglycan-associated protein